MSELLAGFSHVAITCRDLDEARAFYCDTLGLEELRRPEFSVPGMWLRVGALQLHFLVAPDATVAGPGLPHFALHVPAAQWDATIDALVERGVSFMRAPSTREDFGVPVRAAFITDPSGNVIEFTDVGPLAPID